MKKLTVLLTVLIILSHITTCSFAFEATEDERSAYLFASQFINKYNANLYYNISDYYNKEYSLSVDTIAWVADNFPAQLKNDILEKAKEYEDEIRDNYHKWFYKNGKDIESDDNNIAIQYENTSIEDIISSFPVFIEKKLSYMKVIAKYIGGTLGWPVTVYANPPYSVTVSESGFAYVNYGDCYVLLYRYDANSIYDVDSHWWLWVVCDVIAFDNEEDYDEKYRFISEDMDVEKELISNGHKSEPKDKDTEPEPDTYTDTDTDTATDTVTDTKPYRAVELDNIAQNSNESKPTNYIPWVICGVAVVAVIAVAVAFVLKKKK